MPPADTPPAPSREEVLRIVERLLKAFGDAGQWNSVKLGALSDLHAFMLSQGAEQSQGAAPLAEPAQPDAESPRGGLLIGEALQLLEDLGMRARLNDQFTGETLCARGIYDSEREKLLALLDAARRSAAPAPQLPPCPDTAHAGGQHGFECVCCGIRLDGTYREPLPPAREREVAEPGVPSMPELAGRALRAADALVRDGLDGDSLPGFRCDTRAVQAAHLCELREMIEAVLLAPAGGAEGSAANSGAISRSLAGDLPVGPAGGAEGAALRIPETNENATTSTPPSHPNAEENARQSNAEIGSALLATGKRLGADPSEIQGVARASTDQGATTTAHAGGRGAPALSLKDAKEQSLCRICGKPWKSGGGILVLNFGKEYAHKSCLDIAAPEPPLPPLPTAQEFAAATCKEWGNGLSPWWEVIELHAAPLLARCADAEHWAELFRSAWLTLKDERVTPEPARTVRVREDLDKGRDFTKTDAVIVEAYLGSAERYAQKSMNACRALRETLRTYGVLPTQEPESEVPGEVSDEAE